MRGVKICGYGRVNYIFCKIRNIQVDENFMCRDNFDVDLTKLDPVIYSGMYHSIGNLLGKIGDVSG